MPPAIENIGILAFAAIVIGILFFKIRQVIAENRERRAEQHLDCVLADAINTRGSPTLSAALFEARLWTIWERTNPPRILSMAFSVQDPSALGNLEIPPTVLCFSSRRELEEFCNSLLGEIIAKHCDYRGANGRSVFLEALRRELPVRLNPGRETQKDFVLDEIRAMLQSEAEPNRDHAANN